MFRLSTLAYCILAGALGCLGQTPAPDSDPPPNASDINAPLSAPDTDAPRHALVAPANPRIYVPLTRSERFSRYAKGLYNPEALLRSAAGAGIQQASNTPHEWGQGAEGYFRRYGNSYAEYLVRQTIMYGASSALDEDNRFFRSDRQGYGSRSLYAAESTFLARRSDGSRRLSYSRLTALVATGFISREWQPRSTNGVRSAFGSIATTAGTEVGFNVFREFLPKFLHH
jgi:hypothetical protein